MSCHVLHLALVDDDESVRRALSRLLRVAGMEVSAYASGREFLESVCSSVYKVPDCLVLDMRMPAMSGIEVQQHLAKCRPDIPIVFITAHEDAAAVQTALEAGASACLKKPFSEQELLSAISSATAGCVHPA
jgi:FixJ family two-component response regulator